MVIKFIFFLFFCITLFSADLNQTIIKENNVSFYTNLLKDVNKSSLDYTLQRTLIYKIKKELREKKLFSDKELIVKNDDDFVNLFFKINEYLAQAEEKNQEIDELNEQLSDLKDKISELENNASNLTTLQLEYAYYYKKIESERKFIKVINTKYEKILDSLLLKLKDIKFKSPKTKSYLKQIENLNKQIKKLQIQLQRWKILERKTLIENTQKSLSKLTIKREELIKKVIKEKSKKFFRLLKYKDKRSLKVEKEIIEYTKNSLPKSDLANSLEITFNYMAHKVLGDTITYLLNLKDNIYNFLTKNTFLDISLFKLSEALGVFLLFLFFRKLFSLIVLGSIRRLVSFSKTSVDDKLIDIIQGPLKFVFIILGVYFASKIVGVNGLLFDKIIKTLNIFVIFWTLYNIVLALSDSIYRFTKKFGKELYREIGAFFNKILKFFIVSIGVVAILQIWNINVSAFLASLGLGGLAFALAAKDTASNLFGGLSILADRALKIDDWIKVGGVEGTVEEIGLRTIKVRTFEKSLITVPNSVIASNPIENFSRRSVRRIKMRIGLVYDTTTKQMEKILNDIREMLKNHKSIDKRQTLLVNFDKFNDSDLSIFIYCFTNTANWAEYLRIREDVNLKIMKIVEENGSSFAFPSQSIYVESMPKE